MASITDFYKNFSTLTREFLQNQREQLEKSLLEKQE
jgi:hypothetical protein